MYCNRTYPNTRNRRVRQSAFCRNLVRETQLTPYDLVYPVFIVEGQGQRIACEQMPGIYKLSIDQLLTDIELWIKLGIQAIALFPVVPTEKKSTLAHEAFNDEALVQRAVSAIKKEYPHFGVITDVALDPFTLSGHDGVIDGDGNIINDETVQLLAKQALSHAQAGADIVAPSDMMDGRIMVIRDTLEEHDFQDTLILSYAAKYASSFYSPFRSALGSGASMKNDSKYSYQMDCANSDEALQEVALDLQEGADMVMVKPASNYLDIIYRVKNTFKVPTFAYQVSGEYAMQMAAVSQGWFEKNDLMTESLLAIKRAGADVIITYHALEMAKLLQRMT